jgi:hypothetical protein
VFPTLMKNVGRNKVTDNRELVVVLTWRLITQSASSVNRQYKSLSSDMIVIQL